MFLCFSLFFFQVYSATVPLEGAWSVCGYAWGGRVAPAYPFPHLACKLHDLLGIHRGGGGEGFQMLDAVEFGAFAS